MIEMRNRWKFGIALFVLCCITKENEAFRTNSKNEDAREKFANLLTSIADINKKRLKALKIYGHYADYNSRPGPKLIDHLKESPDMALFNVNEYSNGLGDINDTVKIKTLNEFEQYLSKGEEFNKNPERPNIKVGEHKKFISEINYNDDEDVIGEIKIIGGNIAKPQVYPSWTNSSKKDILRHYYHSNSCKRKSHRQCLKVCKATLRVLCRRYDCSSSVKRAIRYSCRGYCRTAFDYY